MKRVLRAVLPLLLCLSLCLLLAPGAFAEEELPVRFTSEKGYDLIGLKVMDAEGRELAPADTGDGYLYLLTPGTYTYVYHDDRDIFVDIDATAFTVGSDALEIPLTLTATFADKVGFDVFVNPAFIGEVEELSPEEYEQRRQELLDKLIQRRIEQSAAEQAYAAGSHAAYASQAFSLDEVHEAIKSAMLQHSESTDFMVFYTDTPWSIDECVRFVKDACVHTGRQREGDTLRFGYSRCGYSFYPDKYDEATGLYCHEVSFALWYRTTLAQEQAVAAEVENLVRELDLAGKTDYQKASAINQWLYMHVDYDYDRLQDQTYTLKYTDYAALIDRIAVCQGFALSFYRMALEAGLDARYVSSSTMNHAWNIVRLNGVYYELDATWDSNWREGGTPLNQLPHFFARGSDWWQQNHRLSGQTYSTIGDQFYADTVDYDSLFNGYTLSAADFDPANDVPPGIAIIAANFHDDTFRAYVAASFDADSNGFLSDEEIALVTTVNVAGTQENPGHIASLKGIEFFPAITTLNCSRNDLTELDISENTALRSLNCASNKIEALEVKNRPALFVLQCSGNPLGTLDVTGCGGLQYLYCQNCGLTDLTVRNCNSLDTLSCSNNSLRALDLSGCTGLRDLGCQNNLLTSIKLSDCANLLGIGCNGNRLASLDLSTCPNLYALVCNDNSLTSLDITSCPYLVYHKYMLEPVEDDETISYFSGSGTVTCDKTVSIIVRNALELPDSLTNIEEEAFANGTFIYVRLPAQPVIVGPRAFAGCLNLTHVFAPSAESSFAADAFEDSVNATIVFPESSLDWDVTVVPSRS